MEKKFPKMMISIANSAKAEIQKMFHGLKSMFVSNCFLKTSPGSLSLIEIRIINLSDCNKVIIVTMLLL